MINKKISFNNFLDLFWENSCSTYIFVFESKVYMGKFFLFNMDDENDFEDNDPRYDEFSSIAFKCDGGEVLEIDYRYMPDKIYCDNKLVFQKLDGVLQQIKK